MRLIINHGADKRVHEVRYYVMKWTGAIHSVQTKEGSSVRYYVMKWTGAIHSVQTKEGSSVRYHCDDGVISRSKSSLSGNRMAV